MEIDTSVPRSRRALLAGGIGGLAALVASALGRPLPTEAGDGETMVVGGEYMSTSVTKIRKTNAGTAIHGESQLGGSAPGIGVYGCCVGESLSTCAGVYGASDSGFGVEGHGYVGVAGNSDDSVGTGVSGHNSALTGPTAGVVGGVSSPDGIGVFGYTGSYERPHAPKTGVYGYAVQDANARGVTGQTTAGRGVNGIATTGTGLYGQATTGYALRAVGRVKLDKCAGVATIAATKSSVVVTPGIDLVSTSAVVATLMGNAGGSTTVKRVAVNTTANTFTIYLTANATVNVKVAWHVFG